MEVKKGGVTLCTDSYSTGEISILREALKKNFNLETSIHNKKVQMMQFMKESILKKMSWKTLNLL
jgi:hypothetical protein